MKRHKLLSWVLSLVMALTVFSVPVGSVYAGNDGEGNGEGEYSLPYAFAYWTNDGDGLSAITKAQANLSEITENYLVVSNKDNEGVWRNFENSNNTYCWKNDNPEVAKVGYWVPSEENPDEGSLNVPPVIGEGAQEFEGQGIGALLIIPQKAGTFNLELTIKNENNDPLSSPIQLAITVNETDLPQYCVAINRWDEAIEDTKFIPIENGTMDFSAFKNDDSLCLCTDEFKDADRTWTMCDSEYKKIVWHNDTPEIAVAKAYNESDNAVIYDGATFECNDFYVVPVAAGEAKFSADVYSDASENATIVAQIPVTINISQKDLDKAKYEPFLEWFEMTWYADVDELKVWGELPRSDVYNNETEGEYPTITSEDMKKLTITATVGGKTTTAVKNEADHEFYAKFAKVAIGTKVTMKYTMGSYTKTETLVVSKWVDPKVTVKSYVYNGKTRKASVTVKIGNTTLKNGTDYKVVSKSLKNVGRAYYEIYNPNDRTNKYRFYKEGYFKINPKGTSLKTLKRAKKAFTATWTKQSAKMSTSRITGYQIMYATNKSFTKGKKTVTVKGYATTSKKIKNLKKKKTYYVKIRTYKKVGKVTYYSPWSKVMSVKTK